LADCKIFSLRKPDDAEVVLLKANCYAWLKRKKLALEKFEQYLKQSPDSAQAYSDRGLAYGMWREYAKALQDFDRALQLNPKDAETLYLRGFTYGLVGKDDLAIKDLTAALTLAPKDVRALCGRAFSYLSLGRDKEGINDLQLALKLDPRSAKANAYLAFCYTAGRGTGRDGKKALAYATRACELSDWKHPYYLESLAAVYSENGDFGKAIEYERKALEFTPQEDQEGQRFRIEWYEKGKPYRDLPRENREIRNMTGR
jgi:tetratricopeptide (TPR) repeat protein